MLLQMVATLMGSKEGREALTATVDAHTMHLDCAVEYQALHGSSIDLKTTARTVLSQLRSWTQQQGTQPLAET